MDEHKSDEVPKIKTIIAEAAQEWSHDPLSAKTRHDQRYLLLTSLLTILLSGGVIRLNDFSPPGVDIEIVSHDAIVGLAIAFVFYYIILFGGGIFRDFTVYTFVRRALSFEHLGRIQPTLRKQSEIIEEITSNAKYSNEKVSQLLDEINRMIDGLSNEIEQLKNAGNQTDVKENELFELKKYREELMDLTVHTFEQWSLPFKLHISFMHDANYVKN